MPSRQRPFEALDADAAVGAEEEAAQAEARAEAARARAMRLRRQAEADSWAARVVAAMRRPGRKGVAVGAAIVLICAALGASGYMAWQHRNRVHERQRAAEFAAAARQGIVTLMSIDAGKAKEDLQRTIDDSTGDFKGQLQISAPGLANAVEQSKISAKVTVGAVAVESMSDDSAVVLVAARSDVTPPDDKRPPRSWRIIVTLSRDGGQPKMSKVEVVP
ncbi:MAG: hypothetical protein ACRDTK_07805 [Mycobacterium sp.]